MNLWREKREREHATGILRGPFARHMDGENVYQHIQLHPPACMHLMLFLATEIC